MFKKKEKQTQTQEIMCDIILRKKLLVNGMWNYKKDPETIKTKKELKEKGFTYIKTEITSDIYGYWEEEIWEKNIGTQLY